MLALISGDADRIRYGLQALYGVTVGPVSLAALVPLLLIVLGPSALAGLTLIVAAVVMQRISAIYTARFRRQATDAGDQRLHLTQEVMGAAAAIKLQGASTAW